MIYLGLFLLGGMLGFAGGFLVGRKHPSPLVEVVKKIVEGK